MSNKNITRGLSVTIDATQLEKVLSQSVKATLDRGVVTKKVEEKPLVVAESKEVIRFGKNDTTSVVTSTPQPKHNLNEATIVSTRTFQLGTDSLSEDVKANHFGLYKGYVESFNKVSIAVDSIPKDDANNPNNSQFRRLKEDEQFNLSAVKLHELYFGNIGDKRSEIRRDSTVFMRLEKDWGSFENWQLDFRACGMAAKEGWAVCYYEPFKQKYINCFVEGHNVGVPVGGIPVLVVDTWHHAWFKDYLGEKLTYLNAMLKEVNWDVVEARMACAESSGIHQLYMIQPSYPTDLAHRPGVVVPSSLPVTATE